MCVCVCASVACWGEILRDVTLLLLRRMMGLLPPGLLCVCAWCLDAFVGGKDGYGPGTGPGPSIRPKHKHRQGHGQVMIVPTNLYAAVVTLCRSTRREVSGAMRTEGCRRRSDLSGTESRWLFIPFFSSSSSSSSSFCLSFSFSLLLRLFIRACCDWWRGDLSYL